MNPADVARLRAALEGQYALEGELGRGGMAVVFRARDLKHDRAVAVKVLRPDLARALGPERFLREIKLTAGLSHPHILPLYDSGRAEAGEAGEAERHELLYYVMPYVEGESLRDRLERDGQLPVAEALRFTREIADGLASAHRHGVVHRDIKPANILLVEGHAIIADFGVAHAVAESADQRLTATGLAIGTPVYMSPEQVSGARDLDGRSDVYALGCVLYEMLAGEPPFTGPTIEAAIAKRFTDPVPRISLLRPDVPETVDRVIRRALAGEPDKRFDSAEAFAAALAPADPGTPPGGVDARSLLTLGRRPTVAIPALLLVLTVVALFVLPARRRAAEERARASLAEIANLADVAQYAEAYDLAARAERVLGDDTTLARLMERVADRFTITTDPPGATVWLQRFAPGAAAPPDSFVAGTTPLTDFRTARGEYRLVVRLNGYAPRERAVSTAEERALSTVDRAGPLTLALTLQPADRVPADMVFVPGGTYTVTTPDAPAGLSATIADFLIDRFEVSTAQYAAFVRAGGYTTPAHWRVLPARTAASIRAGLTDRTGMPAPRDWSGGEPPADRDDHPVTGVSWYEAQAYCASVGKRLPTLFEWDQAARGGQSTPIGILMPWGYSPTATARDRANFSSDGTVPVDRHPFGVSPAGAYAMAGNVKEWLANPMGDGYVVTGGSYQDPVYVHSELGAFPPGAAASNVGFRCARTVDPDGGDQGADRIVNEPETPVYRPVDRAGYRALLTHYRYDDRPLDATVLETMETADWVRYLVRYVATVRDTALGYLYVPHRGGPRYQVILYVASSGAFSVPLWGEVEWIMGPHIRGGRALFAPVLKGMVGRPWPPGWTPPDPPSVDFRDLMVLHATEVRRGIDYLETRDDLDTERLAYAGLSFGAGSRLVFAGVDDRYRAVVLIGAGIDERVQPTLPEAANFNFAPYIGAPKLVVNGANDEEHPWLTRALPLWNLLREPKELVLVEGAGHLPPPEARVPAINAFLDKVLGPVGN